MLWAIFENRKIEASPNMSAICPLCGEKVISKCGEINIWHWAHTNIDNCDTWYEPESFWHKHWKSAFDENNVEITITKNAIRHRADILTIDDVVIELQNSPISKAEIREREIFYGDRMLWLINGEKLKENLTIKDYWEDEDYLELKSLPRPPVRWERRSPLIEKGNNGEFFKWKNPRKSWVDVKRPLFIDFGEDILFRVLEGMGTPQIRGIYFPKEIFFRKYGGNYEHYLQQQI